MPVSPVVMSVMQTSSEYLAKIGVAVCNSLAVVVALTFYESRDWDLTTHSTLFTQQYTAVIFVTCTFISSVIMFRKVFTPKQLTPFNLILIPLLVYFFTTLIVGFANLIWPKLIFGCQEISEIEGYCVPEFPHLLGLCVAFLDPFMNFYPWTFSFLAIIFSTCFLKAFILKRT